MTPRCRECEECSQEPNWIEGAGFEGYAFECQKTGICIGTGIDESDALPKTSPRWCPKRSVKK